MTSAIPNARWIRVWTCSLLPSDRSTSTPTNANGTDPMQSHFTNSRRTVPRRRWTSPPTGFITAAATRSLEIAVGAVSPNINTRTGVINAPPPMPVSPTTMPMPSAAAANVQSMKPSQKSLAA